MTARVLERQGGLAGKGLQQRDLVVGEDAARDARDRQHTRDAILHSQGHSEKRAHVGALDSPPGVIVERRGFVIEEIRDAEWPSGIDKVAIEPDAGRGAVAGQQVGTIGSGGCHLHERAVGLAQTEAGRGDLEQRLGQEPGDARQLLGLAAGARRIGLGHGGFLPRLRCRRPTRMP